LDPALVADLVLRACKLSSISMASPVGRDLDHESKNWIELNSNWSTPNCHPRVETGKKPISCFNTTPRPHTVSYRGLRRWPSHATMWQQLACCCSLARSLGQHGYQAATAVSSVAASQGSYTIRPECRLLVHPYMVCSS
jgi:hypothetical protein